MNDLEKQLKILRDKALEEMLSRAYETFARELYMPDTKEILAQAEAESKQDPPPENPRFTNICAYFAARKVLLGDEEAADKELWRDAGK